MVDDSLGSNGSSLPPGIPNTVLVGTGVVGEAIAAAHVAADVSLCLVDTDPESIRRCVDSLMLPPSAWQISQVHLDQAKTIPAMVLQHRSSHRSSQPGMLIESIPEKREIKQDFFQMAERLFPKQTVFCSNTSTLKISEIAAELGHPERLLGMHFFMPVSQREAVEIIRGQRTNDASMQAAIQHVDRIGKQGIPVSDTPGFVVNRLLAPYLNQSLRLLCQGVNAEAIESAAMEYGMPFSPLQLIDTIGLRTVFDAGRVYWQAFPRRMDPSPLLAGLVKAKRLGIHSGAGICDYTDQQRSAELPQQTVDLIERYSVEPQTYSSGQLVMLMAVPMLIEAAIKLRESTVNDISVLNAAIRGGLGYRNPSDPNSKTWLDFFDDLGSDSIREAIKLHSPNHKSIRSDDWLLEAFARAKPSTAIQEPA